MRMSLKLLGTVALSSVLVAVPARAQDPDARAQIVVEQMTDEEKLSLVQGFLAARMSPEELPENIAKGAGYVQGVERLGVPPLAQTDASLGVANMGGFMRPQDEATAMPSLLAMASTWNPALVEEAGRVMGAEARAKGFNAMLAGGINLVREPRGGRNFEYFSEDPLLSGVLGGSQVRGIQSQNVLSTVKHYLLNAQETGRTFADVRMDEADMRESDLLAFQIAIEQGDPGSVMCSYNMVNGFYTCENAFLLNEVLRDDWGYEGFVMSDWGSVHSVSIRQGLDQESGRAADRSDGFYSGPLREALAEGEVNWDDVDRSVFRIVRSMYSLGLAEHPLDAGQPIDFEPNLEVAQQVAEQGIVLLKNEGDTLPIAASARRILVVGGHADMGVPQGGGSSQVWPVGGASLSLEIPGDKVYHRRLYMPSAPVDGLREQFPQAEVLFDDGSDIARAASAASGADIVVVFAEEFSAENHDQLDLRLPGNQDALIDAVATANPQTVVVLETGNPVVMPWLSKVPAVLQAWYSGNRGGHAIARVLSGAVNPSGRLPVTFPASEEQMPNPVLLGSDIIEPIVGTDLYDIAESDQTLTINYPEGSDAGYRWYSRRGHQPLFSFGHGLSYTSFETGGLEIAGTSAQFTVTNTGERDGATVAQLYLVERNDESLRRLVGFERMELASGETRTGHISIDPRLLAEWEGDGWSVEEGVYRFALGDNADSLGAVIEVRYPASELSD